ncbi:iron-sulfur cluster assembly scaffold protein, partial [Candidatus Dependentiae bacterium]|nr:iron-sulfur cluster assembly scaffold protein [Candidatus Dependentiae bacterium]
MDLYQQELLDHYYHPRNRGTLPHADFSSGEHNPSCGDSVSMQGIVKNDQLEEIYFQGSGCVISQAAASMVTEKYKNKSLKDILSLDKQNVLDLVGIKLGPTRLKCALLAL